ncbi:MAG: hypothetical protein AB4206_03890 [Xenococcaceae cyanobacterium]
MSSSNDPYKSRLFNFLNRQTIRFQDQLGTTVRHLRSATEIGIQILLYPVYLMVQSGRTARQQLESRVQSSLLLSGVKTSESDSSSTTSSVPLDEVLNLVEPWLETKDISNSIDAETIDVSPVKENVEQVDPWSPLHRRKTTMPAVTGVPRSNLPVLKKKKQPKKVTSAQLENIQTRFSPLSSQSSLEIQGVASLLDSHELVLVNYHNRILNVLNPRQQEILKQYLATKHQKPNLIATTAKKVLAILPQISQNKSVDSPPVKIFWQMLDWVKTSSIAKKVDLFGESKLAPSAPILPPSTDNSFLPNLLVSLDNKVADLETKSFLSISVAGNKSLDRSSPTYTQPNVTQSQPDLTSNPFQIRTIIQAAIEHFFGTNSSGVTLPNSANPLPLESKTASSYLPGNSLGLNLPPAEEQESWLSWNDIFSNTISSTVKPPPSETQAISNSTQESSQLYPFPQDKTEDFASITYFDPPNTEVETASDLLETQATTVGYEKHLLERILEILDQIFVWLEERLLKIWQTFR